jgi:hypothetical protein
MAETETPRNFKIDGSEILFVAEHRTLFSRDDANDNVLRIHVNLTLEACGIEESQIQKQAHLVLSAQGAWTLAHTLLAAVSELPAFDAALLPDPEEEL